MGGGIEIWDLGFVLDLVVFGFGICFGFGYWISGRFSFYPALAEGLEGFSLTFLLRTKVLKPWAKAL